MKEFFSKFKSPQKALTSKKWPWQYYGAIFERVWSGLLNLVVFGGCGVMAWLLVAKAWLGYHPVPCLRLLTLLLSVCLLWRTVVVIRRLNTIFCLRRKEARVTWSQIILLLVIALFIVALVEFINPRQNSPEAMMLGGAGLVLGWIFQDTIKSVVAFFYLRINGLLRIDDWIEVRSRGIDGMVRKISLTTVTVENWDTTTSAFPTYILQAEHFKNNQKMVEGRTAGRQMLKTFIIDTGWIHAVTADELEQIRSFATEVTDDKRDFFAHFLSSADAKPGDLNIELYRRYVYHWMMHHPYVSHEPRLLVRWLEQVPDGMPLQVYAYLTVTDLPSFEWQQSQIIEHFIEALAWFHLRLFQTTSGYDASNSNITIVNDEANYRRKLSEHGKIL